MKMTSAGVASFFIVPRHTVSGLGHKAPSDTLYIAAIGCGGEGEYDIHQYVKAPKRNAVVAFLCDVDDRMAAPRIKELKAIWMDTGGSGLMHVLQVMEMQSCRLLLKDMRGH